MQQQQEDNLITEDFFTVKQQHVESINRKWWKEAVVYQIYPRSFADSNGDGFGDCKGVIAHLDYLKDLGIDVIWLSPVYRSPMADNGYDISDYNDINPEFGTLEEFRELLANVHQREMRLIMDLVINHTSDEHPWFKEAKKSKDNPYREYYIWRNGKNGGPPSDWGSYFSGSAWEYDELSGQYYLHLYSTKQPDLNWENAQMRSDIYKMMRWWCDLGIDGFRIDTVNMYSKEQDFPDTGMQNSLAKQFYIDGPRIHDYIQEMNREVFARYDVMTVGEAPDISAEQAVRYVNNNETELNMIFQFEHMRLDTSIEGRYVETKGCSPLALKTVLTKWQNALSKEGWNSLYLGNHDQPRQVSRFGDDGEYWAHSAKLLATLIHTMRGTPFVFEGEELGMTNCPFKPEDIQDIEAVNYMKTLTNEELAERFPIIKKRVRDNARTPMQWNNGKNAGFTSEKPWIMVNPNYKQINAASQINDWNSVYTYYRTLIALRHKYDVFVYGDFYDADPLHENVYCFTRTLGEVSLLIVLNMCSNVKYYELPKNVGNEWNVLLGNYRESYYSEKLILKPWQALVFQKGFVN